tara:strand:- start:5202 stop:5570 length:369 start_codon:yes stop_codon:yes gene_type:complete
MANRATATIIGRLTRDPEVKSVGDVQLVTFGVAVNRKTKDGEHADFFDIEAWRETGEFISKYATKGREVVFDARVKQDVFEVDGQTRRKVKFEVIPYTFDFCGSKSSETSSGVAASDPESDF